MQPTTQSKTKVQLHRSTEFSVQDEVGRYVGVIDTSGRRVGFADKWIPFPVFEALMQGYEELRQQGEI